MRFVGPRTTSSGKCVISLSALKKELFVLPMVPMVWHSSGLFSPSCSSQCEGVSTTVSFSIPESSGLVKVRPEADSPATGLQISSDNADRYTPAGSSKHTSHMRNNAALNQK